MKIFTTSERAWETQRGLIEAGNGFKADTINKYLGLMAAPLAVVYFGTN